MKTACIFGVTGQDGSYLSELLLAKDYVVIGVKRRSSTNNEWRLSVCKYNERFHLVEGDVTDLSSILRILSHFKPDEIYNLSGQSHVKTSFDEPLHTFQVTGGGCLNILEATRLLSTSAWSPRFYQASSSEMFGSSYSEGPEGCYQDENTPLSPNSPYAAAKSFAHNCVRLYRESYGLFACSGVLFNHEAPRRSETFVTRKITSYVARLKHGLLSSPLRLGNLDAKRDWGHARDYVKAMYMMLQHDEPDTFVIGTGETHTVREFLEEAFRVAGIDNPERYYLIDESLFRPSEVPYLRANPAKANKVLGWYPEVSFKGLVEEMVGADEAAI